MAVGYPLGAKSVTVTRGVVSNVHLSDLTLKVFGGQQMAVQIDAAINPGNSGGPVFNATTFALVGVAFAGRKNAEGQGFIIPIPVVNNFLKVFRTTGKPNPGLLPDLGVLVRSLENVQVCIQICEAACLGNINTKENNRHYKNQASNVQICVGRSRKFRHNSGGALIQYLLSLTWGHALLMCASV